MSEISDMVTGGEICEICTDYIGEAVGYPRKCRICARSRTGHDWACPVCGKKLKTKGGVNQHMEAKHGGKAANPWESVVGIWADESEESWNDFLAEVAKIRNSST